MILTSACRHITGLMMSTATHFVLFIESLSDITNYITKLSHPDSLGYLINDYRVTKKFKRYWKGWGTSMLYEAETRAKKMMVTQIESITSLIKATETHLEKSSAVSFLAATAGLYLSALTVLLNLTNFNLIKVLYTNIRMSTI